MFVWVPNSIVFQTSQFTKIHIAKICPTSIYLMFSYTFCYHWSSVNKRLFYLGYMGGVYHSVLFVRILASTKQDILCMLHHWLDKSPWMYINQYLYIYTHTHLYIDIVIGIKYGLHSEWCYRNLCMTIKLISSNDKLHILWVEFYPPDGATCNEILVWHPAFLWRF